MKLTQSAAILLIDENAATEQMISGLLVRSGYKVLVTKYASYDLSLGHPDAHCSLVIFGQCLHGQRPGEFATAFRASHPSLEAIPFVLIEQGQGHPHAKDISHSQEGSAGIIARPLDPGEILAMIDSLIMSESRRPVSSDRPLPKGTGSGRKIEGVKVALVDGQVMRDLIKLGGIEFAAEIADQFIADGARLLKSISTAIDLKNGASFREDAHALRSCAANVGARGIYDLCLDWRDADEERLEDEGGDYVKDLQRCFDATTQLLQRSFSGGRMDTVQSFSPEV